MPSGASVAHGVGCHFESSGSRLNWLLTTNGVVRYVGIGDDGDDLQVVVAEHRRTVVVLRDDGALAVRHAVLAQIPGRRFVVTTLRLPRVTAVPRRASRRPRRRPRAARPARGRALRCVGATERTERIRRRRHAEPLGDGVALPARRRVGRRRAVEVEQARLLPAVRFDSQRVLVGPGDLEPRRQPHDAAGAERAARFAGRGVGRGIPAVGDLPPERVQRHRRVVALRRRDHPPAPVLGDLRDPVAR